MHTLRIYAITCSKCSTTVFFKVGDNHTLGGEKPKGYKKERKLIFENSEI